MTREEALEKYAKDKDLSSANLHGAGLSGADLSGADLHRAYLRYADLSDANLRYADLRYADLSGADLSGANLHGADLSDARGIEEHLIVPESGAFVGYKKLTDGVIAKLLIPEDAERVGGLTGRKCRASKAIVLEGEGVSRWNTSFQYIPGATLIPDSWDNDIRVECSHGIHFFLRKAEAEAY